jgi:hypothetical protein
MPYTIEHVYVVMLAGEICVRASNDDEAKSKALAFAAVDPLRFFAVKEVKDVQVEAPTP